MFKKVLARRVECGERDVVFFGKKQQPPGTEFISTGVAHLQQKSSQ
jgi:hypothetical protein